MECATCLKKFTNKETYVRHQRQKCKLRQCTDCKKLFKTAKSLRNHLKKGKIFLVIIVKEDSVIIYISKVTFEQ